MSSVWLEPLVSYYKIYFGNTAKIIFDIGSRDGDDAIFLKEQLKGEEVYTVEARQDAADKIKEKYPEFNVIATAVSDYEGSTSFQEVISDDKDYVGSSSIHNNKIDGVNYKYKTIEVPLTTMGKIIEKNELSRKKIDLIKVDIEGFTFQFLCGMSKYIKNVKMFHLETEKYSTHDSHRNSNEINNVMRSHGFKLVATQYEWGDHIEDQIWVNGSLCQKS